MLSTMVTSFVGRNLLADGGVDVVAESGGLFNARAGVGAHVDLELAGVDGGEEVLAEPGSEYASEREGKDQKEDEEDAGVIDAEGEQAQIAVAKFLEAGLEGQLKADERIAAGLLSVLSARRRAP